MLARIGVKFFQIVGVPSEVEWSQLQVVNSSSMEEMSKGGGLSVLMSVNGENAAARGNEWLQAVVEGFLKNLDKERVDWLKDTVRWFESISGPNDSLLLVIVLPHEGSVKRALYLAGKGGIRVYVSREGVQKNIWNGDKGASVVSGWLNDGDVVVSGTDRFIDDIWANLEGEVVDMVEEARDSVGAHEKRGLMAGMVMMLGRGEDEENDSVAEASEENKPISIDVNLPNNEETKPVEDTVEESEDKIQDNETSFVEKAIEDSKIVVTTGEKDTQDLEDDAEEMTIDENFKMVEQVVDEIPATNEEIGVKDSNLDTTPESQTPVKIDRDKDFEDRVMGGGSVGQLAPGNEKREKTRRLVVLLGILFLIVFAVALTFGVVKSRRDGESKRFADFASPIDYNLSEALKLKTVNQVRSRALVEEAKLKYSEGKVYEKGRFEEKYKELSEKIDKAWVEISGEKGADGKLFADLGVIREGFVISRMSFDANWGIVAVDKDKGSVALLDKNGSMKIVAGGDKYKSFRSVALSKKGGYFLTDDGVYLVDFKSQSEKKLIDKDDEIWAGVKEVGLFGSSVYLLDKIDIWKYPGLEDGVGKRQRWLKPGVEPDLSKAVDMKIVTDIYVLNDTEEIIKFVSGNKDSYSVRRINDYGTAARMAASEQQKELYVLEKDKKRVVVYDLLNGEYKKQLIWESLGKANDLVMNESTGKLLVAIEGKVFEVIFQ